MAVVVLIALIGVLVVCGIGLLWHETSQAWDEWRQG